MFCHRAVFFTSHSSSSFIIFSRSGLPSSAHFVFPLSSPSSCIFGLLFLHPLVFLLPHFPSFSVLFLPLIQTVFACFRILLSPSSFQPKLHWNEKEQVKSCFPGMRERVGLSGCVGGGCDAVSNHRSGGWRCCPLRPDWCAVSSSHPGRCSRQQRAGVFALWHPPPLPSLMHRHVNTCVYMRQGAILTPDDEFHSELSGDLYSFIMFA